MAEEGGALALESQGVCVDSPKGGERHRRVPEQQAHQRERDNPAEARWAPAGKHRG